MAVTSVLESMLRPYFVLHLFLEDGGNIFPRKFGNHLAEYTVDFLSRITCYVYIRPHVPCSGPTTDLRRHARGNCLLASTDRLGNGNTKQRFLFTASRDVNVRGRKFGFPQAMIVLALPSNSLTFIDAAIVSRSAVM
jgi:hypothetical protein